VAEKLGRRWIGCDFVRFGIHTTRKRLLEIEESKPLNSSSSKYGKSAKPFEILNLGKYERQFWQVKAFGSLGEKETRAAYLAAMLRFYNAEPLVGYSFIHGKKGAGKNAALVSIGPVDSPVTIQEIADAIREAAALNAPELHVLGWEWEMGLNDVVQQLAEKNSVKLKLFIIPKDILSERDPGSKDVQFYELAWFNAEVSAKKRCATVALKDFMGNYKGLISGDEAKAIKNWSDWIDYWAVDFDFKNDTFINGWTSYRTKQNRSLSLTASHDYEKPGTYQIYVKIIDIFGIDTSRVFPVEVR
jgi:hypothetical protein